MKRRLLLAGLSALALLSACSSQKGPSSSDDASFQIKGFTDSLCVDRKITLGVQGAERSELSYESSDENVLSVDSRGVVTAKGKGEASVIAHKGKESSSFLFHVEEAPKDVLSMLDMVWARNYSITYQTGIAAHYLDETTYCRVEGSDLSSFSGYIENLDQGMAQVGYANDEVQVVSFFSGKPGMTITDVLGEDVAGLAKNTDLWTHYQDETYAATDENLILSFVSLMGMTTYAGSISAIYAEPSGHDLSVYCLLNGQRQGFTYEDVGTSHYGLLERYLAFPKRAEARKSWNAYDEKAFEGAEMEAASIPFVEGSSYALSVFGAGQGFTLKDVISGDLTESYGKALLSLGYTSDGEEDSHLGYVDHLYHLAKKEASPTSGSLTYRVRVRYIEPEYLDIRKKPYCPSGSFEAQFSREEISFKKEGASEEDLHTYLEANAPGKFPETEFGEKATSFLLEDMTKAANERIRLQIQAGVASESDLYHFAFYATVSVSSLEDAESLVSAYEGKLVKAGYAKNARYSEGEYHVYTKEGGEEVDTHILYEEDGKTFTGTFGIFFGY